MAKLVVSIGGDRFEVEDMSSLNENPGDVRNVGNATEDEDGSARAKRSLLLWVVWIDNEPALNPGMDTTLSVVVPSCPDVNAVCSGIVVGATAETETGDSDGDWDEYARIERDAGNDADANTGDGNEEDGEGSDAGIVFGEDPADDCGGGEGVLGGVILIVFLP